MAIGDGYTLSGQTKVSDAEHREHESQLLAKRVVDIPNDLQNFLDYSIRTDSQPVYVGFAPKGLAEGTAGWLLYKFTYESSSDNARLTKKQCAYGNWTNRASETYE